VVRALELLAALGATAYEVPVQTIGRGTEYAEKESTCPEMSSYRAYGTGRTIHHNAGRRAEQASDNEVQGHTYSTPKSSKKPS
jgi:hypothetical protein